MARDLPSEASFKTMIKESTPRTEEQILHVGSESDKKIESETSSPENSKKRKRKSAFDVMMGCTISKAFEDDDSCASTPRQRQHGNNQQTKSQTRRTTVQSSQKTPNEKSEASPNKRVVRRKDLEDYSGPAEQKREHEKSNKHEEQKAIVASPKTSPSASPLTGISNYINVKSVKGDLFSCAPGSMLIHACNCRGSWGAGVAAAFRKKYPRAYQIYSDACRRKSADPSTLVGSALIIAPQQAGSGREQTDWIGCLFTRLNYGKPKKGTEQKDKEDILVATKKAWGSLLRQVKQIDDGVAGVGISGEIGELCMPRINAGLFGVPWKETESALQERRVLEGGRDRVWVYQPS